MVAFRITVTCSAVGRHRPMRNSLKLVFALTLSIAACADQPKFKKAHADMTKREKDSIIAESKLPGSKVVKKAMAIADEEARRQAMFDSVLAQ